MSKENTFPKCEHLCGEKQISELFAKGKSVFAYPVRCVFLDRGDGGAARVLVSVPKRKFKKSVDRNRLKRLLREAYRHNKINAPYNIALLYTADTELAYEKIEGAVQHIISSLK